MNVIAVSVRKSGRILVYCALAAEVAILGVVTLAALRLLAFRRIADSLLAWQHAGTAPPLLLARIKRLLKLLARILPERSRCLVCALVARAMLARRGYRSEFYLGVADPGNAMRAHAWLMVGDVYLTGQQTADDFDAVATF
jgi:hypothetical protein